MINNFLLSLLNVVCEMAPYLLLGFFIAGVLHVFVPQLINPVIRLWDVVNNRIKEIPEKK